MCGDMWEDICFVLFLLCLERQLYSTEKVLFVFMLFLLLFWGWLGDGIEKTFTLLQGVNKCTPNTSREKVFIEFLHPLEVLTY